MTSSRPIRGASPSRRGGFPARGRNPAFLPAAPFCRIPAAPSNTYSRVTSKPLRSAAAGSLFTSRRPGSSAARDDGNHAPRRAGAFPSSGSRKGFMQYIQLVEFNTNHPVDEVKQALDAWLETSRGKRTLHMAVVAADHDRPNHYWELLEYTSEQDAVKTAELPETKAAFERWSSLLDGEPTFHNLDVVEQVGAP